MQKLILLPMLLVGILNSFPDYNAQDQWGGVCTTGEAQSPINLPPPLDTIICPCWFRNFKMTLLDGYYDS